MTDFSISKGVYGDLETWIHDSDIHDKLYRVWYKDAAVNAKDLYEADECDYVYFTEFIILPNNDILIGMQSFDETKENKRYPTLHYRKLSEVHFDYVQSDNEIDDEIDDE